MKLDEVLRWRLRQLIMGAIVMIYFLSVGRIYGDYPDVLSQEQNGGRPGEWLGSLVPDTRLAAMGSPLAASEGAFSAGSNPAGLAAFNQAETTFLAAPLVSAGQYAAVSLSHPLASRRFMGVSLLHLGSGEAEKTDELGRSIGSFSESDLAVVLAYAERVTRQFHVGFSAKSVYQTIDEYAGSGFGADAGMRWRSDEGDWSLGLLAQNLIQPQIRLDDERERFPVSLHMSLSAQQKIGKNLLRLIPCAIWTKPLGNFQFWRTGLGIEMSAMQSPSFLFRLGANSREFSAGFGLRNGPISFDYAALWQALGLSHRLGVTFRYGYVSPLAEKNLNDQWARISARETELAVLLGEARSQGFAAKELSGPAWSASLNEIANDLKMGRLDRAEQKLTRLLVLSPGHPQLVALKAKLQELHDHAMAVSALERSMALYRSKDYEEALESSRQALRILGDDSRAREIETMALAQIHISRGHYDLALGQLKKAIEGNPDNDEAVILYRRVRFLIEELTK